MCGIVSYSSKRNYSFNKIQTLALCNSYERGGDATGFYTPSTGIVKDVYTAHEFINKKLSDKLKPDNVLIGHFRKSSIGANTSNNAHPFENDGVVFCHNGTLRGYVNLATKYEIDHSSYNTDSQVLAKAFSKDIKEYNEESTDVVKALYEYEGAAAIVSYDNNTGLMYAFRDEERPLYYGIINGGMYISSLEYPLNIIGCKNIKQFEENVLYTIKEGKIIKKVAKTKSNFYKVGTEWDFKIWSVTKYKYTANKQYTGIKSESRLVEFLEGFRLVYKDGSIKPKQNYYLGTEDAYVADLTKGKRYEVTGYQGAYLWIIDNNGDQKKVLFSCFDLTNVFPVIGRYCTIHNRITATKTGEEVAVEGDILKILSYNFKDDVFKATVLKSDNTYSIPISSFIPFNEEKHNEVLKSLKEEVFIGNNQVEVIEEEDVPWDNEDEEDYSDADGANWVHFDDVESYIDIISSKVETILDKYDNKDEIKHDLDDLFDCVVNSYNKDNFEQLINEKE